MRSKTPFLLSFLFFFSSWSLQANLDVFIRYKAFRCELRKATTKIQRERIVRSWVTSKNKRLLPQVEKPLYLQEVRGEVRNGFYMNPRTKEKYEVFFGEDGFLYYFETRKLVDTGEGSHIFVATAEGKFYSMKETEEDRKSKRRTHGSFTAGRPVHFAGEWWIRKGKLLKIYGKSGHYKPSPEALEKFFYDLVEEKNIDPIGVVLAPCHSEGETRRTSQTSK